MSQKEPGVHLGSGNSDRWPCWTLGLGDAAGTLMHILRETYAEKLRLFTELEHPAGPNRSAGSCVVMP